MIPDGLGVIEGSQSLADQPIPKFDVFVPISPELFIKHARPQEKFPLHADVAKVAVLGSNLLSGQEAAEAKEHAIGAQPLHEGGGVYFRGPVHMPQDAKIIGRVPLMPTYMFRYQARGGNDVVIAKKKQRTLRLPDPIIARRSLAFFGIEKAPNRDGRSLAKGGHRR